MELFPSDVRARRASFNDTTPLFIVRRSIVAGHSILAAVPLVLYEDIQIEIVNAAESQRNPLNCTENSVLPQASDEFYSSS